MTTRMAKRPAIGGTAVRGSGTAPISTSRMPVRPDFESPQAKMESELAAIKTAREQDMKEGRARGDQLFAEGTLGRVNTAQSGDVASVIAARKANLPGFTPEEMQAYRDQSNAEIAAATQGNLRLLKGQQGRMGYNAGIAAGQTGSVLRDSTRAKVAAEQDLFLKSIDKRREALDKLEGTVTSADTTSLDREKFNIDAKNRELQGRLTTEFGYAGLGAAERGGVMQKIVGQEQADALKAQAEKSGGKK